MKKLKRLFKKWSSCHVNGANDTDQQNGCVVA